jgi:hypothetical protein
MLVLDYLDNMPRRRFSDDQMSSIIWAMRAVGGENIPSLIQLRKKQAEMRAEAKFVPESHVSSLGNRFFSNSIVSGLRTV